MISNPNWDKRMMKYKIISKINNNQKYKYKNTNNNKA